MDILFPVALCIGAIVVAAVAYSIYSALKERSERRREERRYDDDRYYKDKKKKKQNPMSALSDIMEIFGGD